METDPEATIAIEAPGPTTGFAPTGWSSGAHGNIIQVAPGSIPPGSRLGDRYEILTLLGEGGMGAVYKARDCELDRVVALKVIRPQLAANPDVLARFKQELILARQITHRNVIRIFDLGMAEGTKFITMEYVEGNDLKTLLRERTKFSPEEASDIMLQVCAGLKAAHQENVIHRDLKPQNIMIDPQGRVLVMDFGLALSAEAPGSMTRTGALMGTPDYMSPEQAQAESVDARSDLFGLGIIFYEMLTGKLPFEAESLLKTLLRRTKEKARPPIEVEPDIPQALNDIVMKCLMTDPGDRYQTTAELLTDLEVYKGITPAAGISSPGLVMVPTSETWKWISVSLAALLAVIAGIVVWEMNQKPAAKQKTLTLLVADFNNTTGDQVFEGTLENALSIALEGASFINAYNRPEARRLADKLQPTAKRLDETLARLVAGREGIQVIVGGSIARNGGGYRLSVNAIDAASGKPVASRKADASSKEAVLAAVSKLAVPIRKALGDVAPESALGASETFTAASLEAAHLYAQGQQLLWEGNAAEAIKFYTRAIELDANLGRAYASMAAAYLNLDQRAMADKYFQQAMARIDRMSDREKYRTRGVYYLRVNNTGKAIQEFTALLKLYPGDPAGLTNLALAYQWRREMRRSMEEGRRATQLYPRYILPRNNLANSALYAGDFETATREAKAVLELNRSYIKAYITLALSALAGGRPAEAAEVYGNLKALGPNGASRAAMGLADLALYEGRVPDAQALLQDGAKQDLADSNKGSAARKFAMLAEADLLLNSRAAAESAAERALELSRESSVLYLVALIYLQAGQDAKANLLISELAKRLEPDPQAYAKLLEAEKLLKHGNAREAITAIDAAQKLTDTWLGHLALGRSYLEAGAFTEADSEFDTCLKRRGEATEVFLDPMPTYRWVPSVYYNRGRVLEGLKSPGAAEAYKTFLAIKEKAVKDPLVESARRRLESR